MSRRVPGILVVVTLAAAAVACSGDGAGVVAGDSSPAAGGCVAALGLPNLDRWPVQFLDLDRARADGLIDAGDELGPLDVDDRDLMSEYNRLSKEIDLQFPVAMAIALQRFRSVDLGVADIRCAVSTWDAELIRLTSERQPEDLTDGRGRVSQEGNLLAVSYDDDVPVPTVGAHRDHVAARVVGVLTEAGAFQGTAFPYQRDGDDDDGRPTRSGTIGVGVGNVEGTTYVFVVRQTDGADAAAIRAEAETAVERSGADEVVDLGSAVITVPGEAEGGDGVTDLALIRLELIGPIGLVRGISARLDSLVAPNRRD